VAVEAEAEAVETEQEAEVVAPLALQVLPLPGRRIPLRFWQRLASILPPLPRRAWTLRR
jgi:hypothetical protein